MNCADGDEGTFNAINGADGTDGSKSPLLVPVLDRTHRDLNLTPAGANRGVLSKNSRVSSGFDIRTSTELPMISHVAPLSALCST